ncbi:MAG: 50S ribosomal protein L18e [Candidatus Asgardarchaeum californiense]|nr:MAG: 50S ribosomal protein L18e [Candidatus Asgardarchaeum californiense]
MVRVTGPTDPNVRYLITTLRRASIKNNAPIWRRLSEILLKPRRKRAEVNIAQINRYTSANDIVVVPGKVLGFGKLDHPVIVGALAFSESAKKEIKNAGGKALSLLELLKKYPKGSNIKIFR